MKTTVLKSFFLLAASFIFSCSPPGPEDYQTDQLLYEAAKTFYQKKQYESANQYFQSLINRFPQSPHAKEAAFLVGESHFKQREYIEAEYEYQNFLKLYPQHEKNSYVRLQLAKTHYHRARKAPERDQSHSESAVYHLTDVIQRYPGSPEAAEAVKLLSELQRKLTEKNFYVARFYLKQKEYGAAIPRLLEISQKHEFPELQQESLYLLAKAYYKLDRYDDSQNYLEQILKQADHGQHRAAKKLKKKISSARAK